MYTYVCTHSWGPELPWAGEIKFFYKWVFEREIPEDGWLLRLWPHLGGKPALSERKDAADSAGGLRGCAGL